MTNSFNFDFKDKVSCDFIKQETLQMLLSQLREDSINENLDLRSDTQKRNLKIRRGFLILVNFLIIVACILTIIEFNKIEQEVIYKFIKH